MIEIQMIKQRLKNHKGETRDDDRMCKGSEGRGRGGQGAGQESKGGKGKIKGKRDFFEI